MEQENSVRPAYLTVRSVAHSLWLESPMLTRAEVKNHPQIKTVLASHPEYVQERAIEGVELLPTAGPELHTYLDYPAWNLEEATALWMDLNPFLINLYKANPTHWESTYYPTLWEKFHRRLDQAYRAASIGNLPNSSTSNTTHVRPDDFLKWAMSQWEWPECHTLIPICEELIQQAKIVPIPTQGQSKVGLKKAEITSILNRLEAIDRTFDRTSMPGRKLDFHELCMKLDTDKKMFFISPSTFDEYLPGLCAFKPGSRKTDYYQKMLPKLGG